jgi:hypothetical protein
MQVCFNVLFYSGFWVFVPVMPKSKKCGILQFSVEIPHFFMGIYWVVFYRIIEKWPLCISPSPRFTTNQ